MSGEGESKRGHRAARAGLVAAAVALFLWLIHPFLVVLALAGLFALLLHDPHEGLVDKLGGRRTAAAAIATSGVLALGALPVAVLVPTAMSSVSEAASAWQEIDLSALENRALGQIRDGAREAGIDVDRVTGWARSALKSAGKRGVALSRSFVVSLPQALLKLFLFSAALFFMLRDSPRIGAGLEALSPFDAARTRDLSQSVLHAARGAILSTFAVAVVQGGLTALGFGIFGVPGALVWGVVAGLLSMVPMVGTIPVAAGGVLYLVFQGEYGWGIGLGVYSMLIVGLSDNLVRPWVQSSGGALHPFLALLGIIGGLTVLGPLGIFVGPVIAALALWGLGHARASPRSGPDATSKG